LTGAEPARPRAAAPGALGQTAAADTDDAASPNVLPLRRAQ
jgi:hypothetical protein